MTDRQILKIIGQNVKQARMASGMTQECLAELVGVHWQTIAYLERGRYPFAVTTFARITKALGIAANSLLDGLPDLEAKRMERIKRAKARKRKPIGQK